MIINYRYVLQPNKNHLKWEWFCCRLLPLGPFRVAGCTTSSSSRHWTMQRSGGQLGRRTGWIQCQTVPSSDWTDLKVDLINLKVLRFHLVKSQKMWPCCTIIVLKETHRQRPEDVIFLHQKEVPQNFLWFVVCRGASCETKEQTMSSLRAELIQSQQVGTSRSPCCLCTAWDTKLLRIVVQFASTNLSDAQCWLLMAGDGGCEAAGLSGEGGFFASFRKWLDLL